MTPPLDQLTATIRQILDDRRATPAQIEELRQRMLHAIDQSSAEAFSAAMRAAFDIEARPLARSFTTDSGIFGRSKPA